MRRPLVVRFGAALGAALVFTAAAPLPAASAEVENIWSRWTNEVLDRDSKWEIPLALIASVPAMILITPVWAGQLAVQALTDD